MPEQYLLALAQFAVGADSEVMRSFSLVLLRRFLFKRQYSTKHNRLTLYDHLSNQTLTTLERALIRALTQEPDRVVRRKLADTVSDVANQAMRRGRPWHALQALAFSMAGEGGDANVAQTPAHRESAYTIFAGCPNLVLDLQTDAVLRVFLRGLRYEEEEAGAVRAVSAIHSPRTDITPGQTISPRRVRGVHVALRERPACSKPISRSCHARRPPSPPTFPLPRRRPQRILQHRLSHSSIGNPIPPRHIVPLLVRYDSLISTPPLT